MELSTLKIESQKKLSSIESKGLIMEYAVMEWFRQKGIKSGDPISIKENFKGLQLKIIHSDREIPTE